MSVTIAFTADHAQMIQATAQVTSHLSAAFASIQAQMKALETASGHGSARLVHGLDAITQATKATARATQVMAQEMTKSFKSVEQAQKSTVSGFTLMQGAIQKTVALLATIGVSVGLAGLAKSAIDVASTFETLDVRLRFLTNSVEEFNQARQFILEFAQTTPLQLDEVSDAFIRLTSSGLNATKMLPILVDAVSAFGGGNESLQSLIRNFQQMSTQAKVSGEELRDIARGSLIPALQIVTEEARKMRISVKDSLAEAGISGPQAIELFLKGAQERFKGSTLIMSSTWSVLVSNLVDQWKIFSDTIIRESGFLNFMKAAAFDLFQLMNTLLKANKAEFVSWGDTGIAAIRKLSLSVASLLDLLNGVMSLGARVQAQFADWERQGSETMANLYNSVAEFFGFTGSFTAKVQADVSQATGAVVGAITSGEITAAVDQTFNRLQQRAEEFRKTQESIQGKTPSFPPPPPSVDTAASKATANRLKAEEDQLKSSLKRQEALIGASYDERRQLIDVQAAQALAQDVTNVNAIAQARTQALRTAAIEEARDFEQVRLAAADRQLAKAQAQIQAEIAAHAGKPEQIAKYEAELTTVVDEAEATRAKIREQTAQVEQQNSRKTVEAQIKSAQELIKITEEMAQAQLKSRVDLVDEQIVLVNAQVDGEVLTQAEGMSRIHALQNERLAHTEALYQREAEAAIAAIDLEVRETALGQAQILQIQDDLAVKLQALGAQRQTQQQEQINELTQGWRQWAKEVQGALGNFLSRWASGEVKSIKDVLNDLKSYFFRIIADMIAYAATKAIILPIVMSVVGGLGGALGGFGGGGIGQTLGSVLGLANTVGGLGGAGAGTGGSGFGLMQGLGLLGSLKTIGSGFMDALGGLTDTLVNAGSTISTALGGPAIYAPGFVGPVPAGAISTAPGSVAGTALGVAGGAAALGGGIYGALNASNNAARAAFAASAAIGGATAAAGAGLLGAAAATAATTGWTGYGLIAAAVMAVIGTVLDKVIKPEGPTLAVGRPTGLDIGAAGGRLQVQGDVGTRVFRRDDVDRNVVQSVRTQMQEGITAAAMAAIDTINAIALQPEALLQPTQAALQRTLQGIQTLNSSNAKKMEKDITEQLRFINLQMVTGLLEPVNLAFDQLRDMGTLEEQIAQLPAKTTGLVDLFKRLNQQISDIASVQNTDVLRQLSAVRNQVENFGNRIAGTAGQTAENIVNGILGMFETVKMPTTEASLETFDEVLAEQVKELSTSMSTAFQALASLRATKESLEGAGLAGGAVGTQMDRLRLVVSDQVTRVSTEIVDQVLSIMDEAVVPTLTGQITQFSQIMDTSFQALGVLRATQQTLEGQGLEGGGVGAQIDRLTKQMSLTAERIATPIVSGALDNLAAELDEVLIQPIRIQATTVNGLFTDSLAALAVLGRERDRLTTAGIDSGQVQKQFERLLDGMFTTVQDLIKDTFTTGTLSEFLAVLVSIPEALANMNPTFARMRQLGIAFAQVAGPIQQVIDTVSVDLQTPAERIATTAQRMVDLRQAITDAGDAADRALPLYGQLAQEIQSVAQLQIDVINTMADEMRTIVNDAADAQVKAINDWADKALEAWNTWENEQIKVVDEWADAMLKDVQTWTESARNTWQTWADTSMDALKVWVDASTKAINDWAESATATAGMLSTVNQTLLAEMSPAAQRGILQGQKAQLEALVRATGSPEAFRELISVNQELLALAKQSDNLALQQQSLDELRNLQRYLTEQLVATTGQSDPVLAQIAVAKVQADRLAEIAEIEKAQSAFIQSTLTANMEAIAAWQAQKEAEIEVLAGERIWRIEQAAALQRQAIATDQAIALALVEAERTRQLDLITSWQEETVRAIKQDMVYALSLIQYELQKIFALQYKELTGQDLPTPTPPTPPKPPPQPPGPEPTPPLTPVGYRTFQAGGMVPAMLEPRERVYTPPMSHAQQGALMSMNRAFPRFASGGMIVPGSGSGDTVSTWMPGGSFVLNRNASRAIGYQAGGRVMGGHGGTAEVHHHYHFPSITFREGITLQQFQALMREQERRGLKRNGGA